MSNLGYKLGHTPKIHIRNPKLTARGLCGSVSETLVNNPRPHQREWMCEKCMDIYRNGKWEV